MFEKSFAAAEVNIKSNRQISYSEKKFAHFLNKVTEIGIQLLLRWDN